MKKSLKLFFLLLCLTNGLSIAQKPAQGNPSSMAYLEQQFPKLTNLYRPELENMHTHYIFAIDVSGSMKKYDTIVTPALKAFSRSLPNGEQVTVIPFGTEAKSNVPGLEVKIDGEGTKQTLETALSTLYFNDGYDSKFRANTDVAKAVEAVNGSMRNNQDIDMNVVVIITDFLNDLPGRGETAIHQGSLVDLNKNFENVTDGKHTRVVAMKLPPMGTMKGFCLDQLKEEVFNNTGITRKFDVVDAISDQAAISHWFDQLAREIMTEKLKAVIAIDNARNLNPRFSTEIDIDGNTTAEIHWKPNKLYTQLQIDSTYTDATSDFYFKNNKKVWQITTDTVVKDIKLGKLKNKSIGLHRYDDEALNIGLMLPTDYDSELKRLSIDKPIPDTSTERSGWLWTFWLPFWLCVTLLVLLIIYIFLVIKAAGRNRSEKFEGEVSLRDATGNIVGPSPRIYISPQASLKIGAGGNNKCNLSDAPWSIDIVKKTFSPFSLKKPVFIWKPSKGYVRNGDKMQGKLSRYGSPTSVSLKCGVNRQNITHRVTINIKKKK